MLLLMPYFFFTSLGNVLGRFLYSTNRSISLSVMGVGEILIYIFFGFILAPIFQYNGLAIALSLSTFFSVLSNLILIEKVIQGSWMSNLRSIFKVLSVCFISFGITFIMERYVYHNFIFSLFIFLLLFLFISTQIIILKDVIDALVNFKIIIKKIWKKE